ncbi:DUF5980 family protein [Sphaerisporangium sp. TRM90804]|uniref:DUF5980 family protein n=1 Tax=Sphaerisporangium sp. TRM90804 TaxID=3031113 RepID=UPI00244C194E|nr:DUF5980 family protein [Sphaerisporangium sp. TRM90804]MDH2428432.1 DUF5980 family protein [Sphaerisporangium sp. TRM90804]
MIHRAARLALGATAGLALALPGTTPASAATWELRDFEQRICVTPSGGHPGTYFIAAVVGTWSTTVQIGLQNLPPGATSAGGTPIPPGSNYPNPSSGATTVNGFVQISIAPLPVGVYTPLLTASDHTETQSVPVTINVKENCY